MENFKLDLSKLTPVAEKDRIKGNWYVVADNLNQYGGISQWHSGRNRISPSDGDGDAGIEYDFWFAIPPNLPGFPKAELPDEMEFMDIEWHVNPTSNSMIMKRIKNPNYPEFTIPSGTRLEQIEAVRKYLAELETK